MVPLVAPLAVAGGLRVFLTALNELTGSVLLWTSGRETLGVVIYSLEEGGGTVLAAAMSVVAVGVIAAIALSPARRRGQDPVAGGIGTTSAVTARAVPSDRSAITRCFVIE